MDFFFHRFIFFSPHLMLAVPIPSLLVFFSSLSSQLFPFDRCRRSVVFAFGLPLSLHRSPSIDWEVFTFFSKRQNTIFSF